MTRNLLIVGTVAVFGLAAALAGVGDAGTAAACDKEAKTAAVSASSSSCCAKGEMKSVSADARRIRGGAANECSAVKTAAAGECATGAVHASMAAASGACAATKTAAMAAGCSQSAATTAAVAHDGCEKGAAAKTAAASGCEKDGATASAAGGDACCASKATATAAGSKEACESQAKTASLKGVVDDLPYRESKRVVLAGAYACGHCTLQKTEDCSPMLKTADGKVYPLLQNSHTANIKGTKGSNIEVSGTVKKVDGVKYLDVKSYKTI